MGETNDIFGYRRNGKPSGVFSSEDSNLFIGSARAGTVAKKGYLIQNWSINYAQNVEELFEIGSNRLYWMKGRPQGSGGIGRVIGAADADGVAGQSIFPQTAFDICDGGPTMIIAAAGGHCVKGTAAGGLSKGIQIQMSGVIVTAIGFSMAVPDVRLIENFGYRFAKLELNSFPARPNDVES